MLCSFFVLFLLDIVLSVLLRYTDSAYPLWYLQTRLIFILYLDYPVMSITSLESKHIYIVSFCSMLNIDSKLGHKQKGTAEQNRRVAVSSVRGTTRRTLRQKTDHHKEIQTINN